MNNTLLKRIRKTLLMQAGALSVLNRRVIGYSLLLYALFALHHFFPVLYTLYTFENLTYVLLFQVVLFIISNRAYFFRISRVYMKQISAYFEVMNFFLVIVLFVGIFLFSIRGGDITDLASFLILFAFGSLYNAIYQNTPDVLFKKESLGLSGWVFLLGVNGGIYLFLKQFLLSHGLEVKAAFLPPLTLLIFNGAALALFTDIFEHLHRLHTDRVALLPRKMARRVRTLEMGGVIFLGVVVSMSALGYVYYGKSIPRNIPIPEKVVIESENSDFPDDFFLPVVETTGSFASTGVSISGVETPIPALSGTLKKTPQKKIGDTYAFNRYIGLGDQGKDVSTLQNILKKSGFYLGSITGKFDITTGQALAKFIQAKTFTKTSYTQLGPKALEIFKNILAE